MSNKLRQVKNLTNWFGIDSIFFEGKQPFEEMSNTKFVNYNSSKGSLLACLYEMYHVLGYNPDTRVQTSSEMSKIGTTKGLMAIREAEALITKDPKIKKIVRDKVTSLMESASLTEDQAHKQALKEVYSIALDKLLIEDAYKAGDRKELDSNRGRMVSDAYVTLKTKLIDSLI